MADISISPKFKDFASKWYNVSKVLYFVLIHALLFFYSPFVMYSSDKDGTIITIDVEFKTLDIKYNKTIVLQNG